MADGIEDNSGVSSPPRVQPSCDHAVEIAQLRAEAAELRARIDLLTGKLPLSPDAAPVIQRDGGKPLVGGGPTPAAALFGVGGGLPFANRDSTEAAKIGLFRALFAGRGRMCMRTGGRTPRRGRWGGRLSGGLVRERRTVTSCH